MLQFKDGQFREIDAVAILPRLEGLNDYDKAMADAGFENWQTIGDEYGFYVVIRRRYDAASEKTGWLMTMTNAIGGYPDAYCDSDADFMNLFLRLGPMLAAATLDIIIGGIEGACMDMSNKGERRYDLRDLVLDLVKKR
jgi:hypothetical protein